MIFSVYTCRELCDNMYNKSPDERNDVRRCNMGDMGSLYGVNDAIKWLFGFWRKGTGRMGSVEYQECPRGPMDKASAYEAGDCVF